MSRKFNTRFWRFGRLIAMEYRSITTEVVSTIQWLLRVQDSMAAGHTMEETQAPEAE